MTAARSAGLDRIPLSRPTATSPRAATDGIHSKSSAPSCTSGTGAPGSRRPCGGWPSHVPARGCSRQRSTAGLGRSTDVRPRAAARTATRRGPAQQRNTSIAIPGQQTRLDELAPRHRVGAGGLFAHDGWVRLPGPGVARRSNGGQSHRSAEGGHRPGRSCTRAAQCMRRPCRHFLTSTRLRKRPSWASSFASSK